MSFKMNLMLVSDHVFKRYQLRICDFLFDFEHIFCCCSRFKAQAQECVLEKSIVDNRKHSINAKISAQIVDYYKLALVNVEKPDVFNNVGSRRAKVSVSRFSLSSDLI